MSDVSDEDVELAAAIQGHIGASRREHTAALRLIAKAALRGTARNFGYRDTESWLSDSLVITPTAALRLVWHAQSLEHLPVLAAAAAEGRVASEQVSVISDTIEKLPTWASPADRDQVEKTLTDKATTHHARGLRRWGRALLNQLETNEPAPAASSRNEANVLVQPSGRVRLVADLAPEPGALLTTMLSSLTTPDQDPRSAAERAGDALAEILHRAADGGSLPEDGGQKPHVTVTVSLETLRTGIGTATLHTAAPGGPMKLSAAEARRIACDAEVIPMVLGTKSEPLDVGRTTRTVPTALRKAVMFRDQGVCSFPNCDRPMQWTDVHHCRHWLDGGPTKLDNLALLCRQHHMLLHNSDWTMTIVDGVPTFTPPASIDPRQTPRTNRVS
ncbi:MAG TPA: DUF222 domain-containing protein [Pseudonocardiaceae bacterium]